MLCWYNSSCVWGRYFCRLVAIGTLRYFRNTPKETLSLGTKKSFSYNDWRNSCTEQSLSPIHVWPLFWKFKSRLTSKFSLLFFLEFLLSPLREFGALAWQAIMSFISVTMKHRTQYKNDCWLKLWLKQDVGVLNQRAFLNRSETTIKFKYKCRWNSLRDWKHNVVICRI